MCVVNYKIAKTMLVLCVVYLIGFYILKFIFPDLLLQAITSKELLALGEFVNSWKGFEVIINCICNFIALFLFSCACSGIFKKSIKEILIIISAVFVNAIVYYFFPEFYTHTSISCMLIISLLCKGKLNYTVISFVLHGYLSQLLLYIRGFETVLVQFIKIGVIGNFVISLEGYVWLALLSIIFYFKENKQWE